MSEDGNAAVFIGTFLQNGDTVALCEDCLPQFTAAITAQMSGVEIDALAAFLAGQASEPPADPAAAAAEVAYPIDTPEPEPEGEPAGVQAGEPEPTADTGDQPPGADTLAARRTRRSAA